MRRSQLTVLLALLSLGLATGWAQDTSAEKNRLLSKRAAEADAIRKLAEVIYGLQLNARTYVRDFVAESDDIRSEVDSFIKGVRLGKPTYYEDGTCEVPAEVTVAKVVETLRTAHDRYYKGDDIKTSDFESLTKRIDKSVIKVIGSGAPRADLPPDLPPGSEELLGPPPVPAPAKPALPDIWTQVDPRARMMAIQAARVDAMRRLAERLKGLRISARTTVRDFVAESDEINTDLSARLHTSGEEVRTYLHSDELIAEVTLRIPTEQVITTVKELHSRYYNGDPDDTKGHDLADVIKTVVKKDFEETGMGVPPERYLRQYVERTPSAMPDWAVGQLTATGQGTDPAIDTPQGRLKAARAAEIDAKRRLGEQIAGLRLNANTLVKDLTLQHDEIGTVLDALISGARITRTDFADNTAIVTVVLPGMEVWGAVNDGLRPPATRVPPLEPLDKP